MHLHLDPPQVQFLKIAPLEAYYIYAHQHLCNYKKRCDSICCDLRKYKYFKNLYPCCFHYRYASRQCTHYVYPDGGPLNMDADANFLTMVSGILALE
jgi:hypothetical protein